jgi:glycosyltransferase involved in cell wall biosynthesis
MLKGWQIQGKPLISVGLPTYNKASYLRQTIETILNQSFRNFELIISDDESQDDSMSICEEFSLHDSRVRLFKQDHNLGMIENFDFVLNKSRGKYFIWISGDDFIDQNWLDVLLKGMSEEVVISFGRLVEISKEGKITKVRRLMQFRGPLLVRVMKMYWSSGVECNFLHGLARTEYVKSMGGLNTLKHAGLGFDRLYAWQSLQQGFLVSNDGSNIYKRDSINNWHIQSLPLHKLALHAILPAVPIQRVLLLHTVRLCPSVELLLMIMFVPRCIYALILWYLKGISFILGRLFY